MENKILGFKAMSVHTKAEQGQKTFRDNEPELDDTHDIQSINDMHTTVQTLVNC